MVVDDVPVVIDGSFYIYSKSETVSESPIIPLLKNPKSLVSEQYLALMVSLASYKGYMNMLKLHADLHSRMKLRVLALRDICHQVHKSYQCSSMVMAALVVSSAFRPPLQRAFIVSEI